MRRFKGSQDEACGEGCNGIHVSAKIQSVRPKPSEWVPEECDKGNQIEKRSGGTTLQVDADDQEMETVYGIHRRRPNTVSNLSHNKVNLVYQVVDRQS